MNVNGEHWLIGSMASRGGKTAMIWKGQEISYHGLVNDIRRWSEELIRLRITAGNVVGICGDYSPSVCGLMISLIANRNVIVPLTLPPGARRSDFLRISQAKASFHFESGRFIEFVRHVAGAEHELLRSLRYLSAPGLILFSSGSTGASKAALLNFDKLLIKFRKPRPALRTLTFLLLD